MPRVKQTKRQQIEADSFENQLRKKFNSGFKETVNSVRGLKVLPTKIPESVVQLPDDIFIKIERRFGQWQIILVDETLRVTVGYSDFEDSFERANKGALEQYAKNKGA